jgi:hypothetical protein
MSRIDSSPCDLELLDHADEDGGAAQRLSPRDAA